MMVLIDFHQTRPLGFVGISEGKDAAEYVFMILHSLFTELFS